MWGCSLLSDFPAGRLQKIRSVVCKRAWSAEGRGRRFLELNWTWKLSLRVEGSVKLQLSYIGVV